MVILGLEKPVEYGSRQIFDPTMANMVLNAQNRYVQAMREDYLQGREDLKEFNKNFGDFFSPIQKDMEWYDQNVTGATRDLINNLYAQGIDPLRSAEGRAAISRWVNSMPVGKINQLKESAVAANEYLKNRGILESAGKFDRDLEDFVNKGMTLDNWDTARDGMWTRRSPIEAVTLRDLTYDSYKGRTPRDLTAADFQNDPRLKNYKWDPRYRWSGYLDSDLMKVAPGASASLASDPRAAYFRDLARKKVIASGQRPTEDAVEKQFQRDIADANAWALIDPINKGADEYVLLAAKNAAAQRIASMRGGGGRSGNGNNNQEEDGRTTFMDRLQRNVNLHVEDKLFGRKTVGSSIAGIANYWDKMAKSVEPKGKVVGEEVTNEKVPMERPKNSFSKYMFGGLPQLQYSGSDTYVANKENKTVKYDQTKNSQYNKYVYERDRWLHFGNTGEYQVSKYDTSKEAAQVRKILKEQSNADKMYRQIYQKAKTKGLGSVNTSDKKFLEQYIKNKQIVDSYKQNDILRSMYKANSNSPAYLGTTGQTPGTTTTADLKRRSSKFWDSFRAESLSDHEIQVLQNLFNGNANEVKDPNLPNSYKELSLSNNYSYAPNRQANVAGSGRFKHNDVHSKFNRWLHSDGVTLMSFDSNNLQASILPVGGRVGGQLDVMKHPIITKEQFKEFYNKSGASKYGTMEDVAKKLGLGVHKKPLTYKGKDDVLHETDTYYSVPVIGTFDPSSYRDINISSDKIQFGASEASKGSIDSENQALQAQQLLEAAFDILN